MLWIIIRMLTAHQFLPRYSEVNIKALGEHEKAKNWNLQLIGTLPELQRRGLATALAKAVEEKVGPRTIDL